MAEKINVQIRGQQYSLKGDDESLIRHLADEVDNEIKSMETSHLNQSNETVAILAGLNIAEKRYNLQKQKKIDEDYLINELDRMAKYLNEAVSYEFKANVH
jgi:cell division protein ZapA (FtsZ GTPase activity inhibitor)